MFWTKLPTCPRKLQNGNFEFDPLRKIRYGWQMVLPFDPVGEIISFQNVMKSDVTNGNLTLGFRSSYWDRETNDLIRVVCCHSLWNSAHLVHAMIYCCICADSCEGRSQSQHQHWICDSIQATGILQHTRIRKGSQTYNKSSLGDLPWA